MLVRTLPQDELQNCRFHRVRLASVQQGRLQIRQQWGNLFSVPHDDVYASAQGQKHLVAIQRRSRSIWEEKQWKMGTTILYSAEKCSAYPLETRCDWLYHSRCREGPFPA